MFSICTAGHINHGKTSLIKELTGEDTDRLDLEKDRGMSIELGFAKYVTSKNLTASIIDALWYILVSIAISGYGAKNFLIDKKKMIQKITGSILLIIAIGLFYNTINY